MLLVGHQPLVEMVDGKVRSGYVPARKHSSPRGTSERFNMRNKAHLCSDTDHSNVHESSVGVKVLILNGHQTGVVDGCSRCLFCFVSVVKPLRPQVRKGWHFIS